jgi:hypothetical protein
LLCLPLLIATGVWRRFVLHVQAVVDGDREKDGGRAACENAVEQARKKRDRKRHRNIIPNSINSFRI